MQRPVGTMWNTVADARRGTQTFPKSVVDKDRHFPFYILQRPTTFLRLSAASTPTVCSCKPRTRPSTFLAIRRLTRCLSLPDPTSKCCVSRKKRKHILSFANPIHAYTLLLRAPRNGSNAAHHTAQPYHNLHLSVREVPGKERGRSCSMYLVSVKVSWLQRSKY